MNDSFETIRNLLKQYHVEDNDTPPKLIIAGNKHFLDIEHKRKPYSQFVIGVREFIESEKSQIERLLDDITMRSKQRTLSFLYTEKGVLKTVIKDFEDYYNITFDEDLFKRSKSFTTPGEVRFYLIIVILENYYYEQ